MRLTQQLDDYRGNGSCTIIPPGYKNSNKSRSKFKESFCEIANVILVTLYMLYNKQIVKQKYLLKGSIWRI